MHVCVSVDDELSSNASRPANTALQHTSSFRRLKNAIRQKRDTSDCDELTPGGAATICHRCTQVNQTLNSLFDLLNYHFVLMQFHHFLFIPVVLSTCLGSVVVGALDL